MKESRNILFKWRKFVFIIEWKIMYYSNFGLDIIKQPAITHFFVDI